MKAAEVVTAVRRHYGCEGDDGIGPEWCALDELELNGPRSPRIDLLVVRAWGGGKRGHERHAVEVKVSRADLRRELTSGKWQPWALTAHRFYLAVPADLSLDGIELPDRWGLLTVTDRGVKRARIAPRDDQPADLPERCVVELARRAGRAEARIRGAAAAAGDDPAPTIARLERELTAARRQAETARQAETRADHRVRDALAAYAMVAPTVPCRCGTPLAPARVRSSLGWRHDGDPGPDYMPLRLDQDQAGPCRYPCPDLEQLAETLEADDDQEAAS